MDGFVSALGGGAGGAASRRATLPCTRLKIPSLPYLALVPLPAYMTLKAGKSKSGTEQRKLSE